MLYMFLYFVLFALWMVIEIMTAPKGYEDENGFHLGEPADISSKGEGENY
jgi:hypothetical protein